MLDLVEIRKTLITLGVITVAMYLFNHSMGRLSVSHLAPLIVMFVIYIVAFIIIVILNSGFNFDNLQEIIQYAVFTSIFAVPFFAFIFWILKILRLNLAGFFVLALINTFLLYTLRNDDDDPIKRNKLGLGIRRVEIDKGTGGLIFK